MNACDVPSPKDTSLIRTEFLDRRVVLIRGELHRNTVQKIITFTNAIQDEDTLNGLNNKHRGCHFGTCTVKLLYKDHPSDQQNMVFIHRQL